MTDETGPIRNVSWGELLAAAQVCIEINDAGEAYTHPNADGAMALCCLFNAARRLAADAHYLRPSEGKPVNRPWDNGYSDAANDAAQTIIHIWHELQNEAATFAEEEDEDAAEGMVQANIACIIDGAIDAAKETTP